MKVEGADLDRVLGLYPVFVGSTVNISCSLNNSSWRLRLALRDQVLTDVIIVDNTTVMVTASHQKQDRYFYRCCVDQCPPVWMYDPRVAGVTLQYAYPVVKVTGFFCVAPDYHYINCSWSLPERRPFLWNMTFSIPGYVSEMQKECPPPPVYGNVTVYSCVIGLSSRQEFYKTQDYSIQLSGASVFSTSIWNGTIHAGINIVQYSPIRKVQLEGESTENQFTVNWTEPVVISGTVPQYKVLLNRLQSDQKKHVRTYNATRTMLSVKDLDPGVTYQVEVQAKPEQSLFWSNSRSLLVTTASGSSRIGLIVGVTLAGIVIVILVAIIIYRGRHILYKYDIEIPRTITNILQNPDVNDITSKTKLDPRTSDSGVEVDNSSAERSPTPEESEIVTQNPEVPQDTRVLLSTHVFATLESNRTMPELNIGRGTDTPGTVIGSRELSTQGTTPHRSQCSHTDYVITGDIAHAMSGESNPLSISSYSLMEKDYSSASGGDILRFSPTVGVNTVTSVSGQQSISPYAGITTENCLFSVANYSQHSKSGNCKITHQSSISVKEDTKTNLSYDQINLAGTTRSHAINTDNLDTFAVDSTYENMSDQLNLTNLPSSNSSHLNEKDKDSTGIVDKVSLEVTGSLSAVSSDSCSGSMSSYVRIEHESKQSSHQSVSSARKITSVDAGHQKSSADTGYTLFCQ